MRNYMETYLFELEVKLQDALHMFCQRHHAGIP